MTGRRVLLIAAAAGIGWLLTLQLIAGDQEPPSRQLERLFEDAWQQRLEEDPLFATEAGVHRYNDRLPIDTAEDHARYLEEDRAFLERLAAIDKATLSREDQLNHELFEFIVGSRATLAEHRPWSVERCSR